MPKRVPLINNLLINKQLLKILVFYKQEKPIILIGWFLKVRKFSLNLKKYYFIWYSSSFRYNVAIPISRSRAASALFPFV